MPELPEVETVVRRLAPHVTGRTVTGVEILWQRTVHVPSASTFCQKLIGATILAARRRGKYLLFPLSNGYTLLSHLRMSGDLIVASSSTTLGRYVRARIAFENGSELRFDDTRKFGKLYLVAQESEIIGALGPEPLDENFTLDEFARRVKSKKGTIKPLLLNQSFLAGLGNIYAVESLWRAGIHPRAPANRLSRARIEKLFHAIRQTLGEAVQNQGTDIGDGVWKAGGYATRAYGRSGKPCVRCGALLKRIVLGQRGTEFCPRCQLR